MIHDLCISLNMVVMCVIININTIRITFEYKNTKTKSVFSSCVKMKSYFTLVTVLLAVLCHNGINGACNKPFKVTG